MEDEKHEALTAATGRLGLTSPVAYQILSELWARGFEQGRLAALDEFQDRFCVCMKS